MKSPRGRGKGALIPLYMLFLLSRVASPLHCVPKVWLRVGLVRCACRCFAAADTGAAVTFARHNRKSQIFF